MDALDKPWSPDVASVDTLGWVDVAFVIDATGSMAPYIDEARRRARETAEKIAAEGDLNLRFALVAYRDHPPQDTEPLAVVADFGTDWEGALGVLVATGGGDHPEAVWDGLAAAGNLQWRAAADKRCFLIGDAPPHGYGTLGDAWPDGCPCGLTARGLTELFASKRITLHALSIAGDKHAAAAFKEVAEATGGDCEEVDTPAASTASYGSTMSATSDTVADSRSYMAYATASASAGLPVTAAGASAALGWSGERATATADYLSARGVAVPGTVVSSPKKRRQEEG